jgi:hypothetical protein
VGSFLYASLSVVAVVPAFVLVVIYGWFANRWVALAMPPAWGALALIVLRLIDLKTGGCHVCGEDEDWSSYPLFFGVGTVLPATFAVLVGVGARRSVELKRSSCSGTSAGARRS